MIRSVPLSIAAALLAAGLSLPATAETTVRVSYRDLDLATPSGQKVLSYRLRRAADRLCFAGQDRDLGRIMACRSDVLASTRPAVQFAVDEARSHRTADARIAVRTLR